MINGRKESRPVHNATPLCPCPSPSPTPTLNQRNPQFDPIPMVVEVGKYGQGEPSTHTGTFTFFFLEASWWSSEAQTILDLDSKTPDLVYI